jgi:hypothetical protein
VLGVGHEDAFAAVPDRLEGESELLFGAPPLGHVGKGEHDAPARVVAHMQGRRVDLGPMHLAVLRTEADHGVADFAAVAQGAARRIFFRRTRRAILAQNLGAEIGDPATKQVGADRLLRRAIDEEVVTIGRNDHQAFEHHAHGAAETAFALLQPRHHLAQRGDILLDRHVVGDLAFGVADRCNQRPFPIDGAVAPARLQVALPALPAGDRFAQLVEERFGQGARVEHVDVLPERICARVAGRFDEAIVHVLDAAVEVGDDDRRRVLLDHE